MYNSVGGEHQLGGKQALMRCVQAASEVTALLCLSVALSSSLSLMRASLSLVFGQINSPTSHPQHS